MNETNKSTRLWDYPSENHKPRPSVHLPHFTVKQVAIGVFVVLVIGMIGLYFNLRGSTYDVKLTVVARTWSRTLSVEKFQTVHHTDEYASHLPSDAFNVNRYTVSHSAPEYCDRDVESGKTMISETYLCGMRTWTDDMTDYDVNRWVWDHDLPTSGDDSTDPVWADFTPSGNGLGATRIGGRKEVYTVNLKRGDNDNVLNLECQYTDWQTFKEQSGYTIKINRLEQPQWATLNSEAQ